MIALLVLVLPWCTPLVLLYAFARFVRLRMAIDSFIADFLPRLGKGPLLR